MKYILPLFLILAACGSKHRVIQEGQSYTYVIIQLDFLKDIQQICADANPRYDFSSDEAQKKTIAQCTLDNMDLFNIDLSKLQDFSNEFCGPDADLSALSPEEQQNVINACQFLTGGL